MDVRRAVEITPAGLRGAANLLFSLAAWEDDMTAAAFKLAARRLHDEARAEERENESAE